MNALRQQTPIRVEDGQEGSLPEFSQVSLAHSLNYRGIVFAKGAKGVVVHRHDADAYEVEFTEPEFQVLTLRRSDLTAST